MEKAMTNQVQSYLDLTHPISDEVACTFDTYEDTLQVKHMELSLANLPYQLGLRIDNLHMSKGTHVLLPFVKDNAAFTLADFSLINFMGSTIIIDISHKIKIFDRYFNEEGDLDIDLNDLYSLGKYFSLLDNLIITVNDILSD